MWHATKSEQISVSKLGAKCQIFPINWKKKLKVAKCQIFFCQVPSHFAKCQIWHLAPNLETLHGLPEWMTSHSSANYCTPLSHFRLFSMPRSRYIICPRVSQNAQSEVRFIKIFLGKTPRPPTGNRSFSHLTLFSLSSFAIFSPLGAFFSPCHESFSRLIFIWHNGGFKARGLLLIIWGMGKLGLGAFFLITNGQTGQDSRPDQMIL